MKIFYFTATGNSLAVAKQIGGELLSIPQQKEPAIYRDDVIGVVFPVYGCAVPKVVKRFLRNAFFEAEYTFAIGTYGNGRGAAMDDAIQIAKEQGYRFDYVNAVLMLDNCQPQFDIDKQREKLPDKKVEQQIQKICEDIEARKCQKLKCGVMDRFATWLCTKLPIEPEDNPKNFFVDENCVKCGTCADVCPVRNIQVSDKVRFSNHCACCQACIHACPKRALHYKGERNTARWRNPEVTLEELIEANRQKD